MISHPISHSHFKAWLSAAAVLLIGSFAVGEPQAFLTHPDIHGNRVVFTAEGDLWMADVTSGDAWRITSDPGVETNAHFSPDGSQIAFTGNYDGGPDVYVMPTSGGTPRRLTFEPNEEDSPGPAVLGWTPDGTGVLFSSGAKIYGSKFEQFILQQLYVAPIQGGVPRQLPVPKAAYACLNQDGHSLVYVPSSASWMNWFRYQAGQADKVWLTDLNTGKYMKLTDSEWVDTEPIWVGQAIYFVSERSGVRNLWKLDPKTKEATQITFSKDVPVRFPSTDGKRIVFQLGTRLEIYDPATKQARIFPIHLQSDRIHARPFEVSIAGIAIGSVGPAGKRVALAPRGHLVTAPIGEGVVRTLVNDSAQRVQYPEWSPDGKQIAYVSDASGEEQLYLVADLDGATPKQLTHSLTGEHGSPVWSPDGKYLLLGNRANDIQLIDAMTGEAKTVAHNLGSNSGYVIQQDFAFSPDSKWVAYSISLGWRLSAVFLYEVASGKSTLVSHPDIDSSSPVFSADGKFLFVLQDRSLTSSWTGITGRMNHLYSTKITGYTLASDTVPPFNLADGQIAAKPTADKPIRVELDGLPSRNFDMQVPAGAYSGLFAVPGRLLIQSDSGVVACDTATGKVTTLDAGARMLEPSADGKKLLVSSGNGLQVIDTDGGTVAPGTGALKLDGLTVTVDREKEWRQIFFEAWRIGRDQFYDPNMLGVDWKAIKLKYEAELPMVASRYDLVLLMRDMISELNTGHSFAGAWPDFVGKPLRPGVLGIDLVWDAAGGAYRIKHILRGSAWSPESRSPFAEPGVNVHDGDYLLKISGHALTQNQDPAELLLGTAGRQIEVTVSSTPSLTGGRTLTVKPLASDHELRTEDWAEQKRAYVARVSGGQIAYVYLSNLSEGGANEFAEQYYPNVNKPGIIIDVRGNDGGNISGNILSDLASRITGYFAYRAGGNYRREGWAPLGRLAAITDEFAFSDADYFSDCFKRLKLGPLIGHRTTGGVVGPVIYRFMDDSGVGIPNYGAWAGDEWIVEGRGAVPDYEVDQDPAAVMAGKDPQLDKAIEVLMAEIKSHPFKEPKHPLIPTKLGGSRG